MNYCYQKVDLQIAEYVRTVLVFDNGCVSTGYPLPLFTNGMPALLCKGNNCITIYGQSVPGQEWSTEGNETTIGFFFKPFALGPIFKLPAHDLKVKPVELNLWNAQKAMALNIQLHAVKSTQEKVEVLSHFIHSQIQINQRDCEIIRYATDNMMQNSKADALSKLLDDLNLTERTFQRIFKKYVGITANEYRRICQFDFAFSQLKGGHFETLTEVAYSNGYFDQSHYTRSFKEFTNTTPNEYLQSGLDKGR
jgi:AraC-like DNA-binding protein